MMVVVLVLASLVGIYATLLLRIAIKLERDTPLVVFLMIPYVLQLGFGLVVRKEKWPLRILVGGMVVLSLVGAYFWSLASLHMDQPSEEAYTRARGFLIFVAEILGVSQYVFVALMVAIAWSKRSKRG